jgi:hypothetical protein
MIEKIAEVANTTIEALKSAPVLLGLLLVNVVFLGVFTYVFIQIASSTAARSHEQIEMINALLKDLRECRIPGPTKS